MSILFENLQQELASYSPQTSLQQRFKSEILSCAQSVDILSADYFRPGHITVSALVLSPDRQQIALIFHPFLQLWLQPGGHLEASDESLLAGSMREAEEEISAVSLQPLLPQVFDLDIHTIPENAQKKQPSHLHLDFRFLFRSPRWDIQASSEIKEARWVSLSEIDNVQTDQSVRRLIAKLFSI